MAESLVELVRAFRAAVASFQPELHSGEDCAVLAEEPATAEKACAAARVRAAARAGACGEHRKRGFADVSDWMARASGSTASSAKATLDTAAALESQPEAKSALESGELSLAQARELVKAEAACPGSVVLMLDSDAAAVGLPDRRSTIAADAFVRLVETAGKGKSHTADLVIVCDLRAYRRGHAVNGEPCHIIGGGPIPVPLARELGRDAFLKAVLHDGVKIDTIAHFGRRYPAVLRTALQLGTPPDFERNTCSAPGCDRRYHLERDHIDPVANGGETSVANLGPLCWPRHQAKTRQDRKAGLLRGKPRGPD